MYISQQILPCLAASAALYITTYNDSTGLKPDLSYIMKTDAYKRTTVENRTSIQKRRAGYKRIRRIKSKKRKFGLILPSIIFSMLLFFVGVFLTSKPGIVSEYGSGLSSSRKEDKLHGGIQPTGERESLKSRNTIPERHLAQTDDSDDMPYKHSDILEDIGDKSPHYAKLRKLYDAKLPEDDTERMKNFVQNLRQNEYVPIMKNDMTYDIHNCPLNPPADYPFAWNVAHVLDNWPPDDPTPRLQIYQGICVFDFETERDKAMNYRAAEVPFIVRDDPQVLRTAERWNQPGYMEELLGNNNYRTEYSPNNHFMYWNLQGKKKKGNKRKRRAEREKRGELSGILKLSEKKDAKSQKEGEWKPPTEMLKMPYREWLSHANITDESKLGPDMEHWYYRLIGCGAQIKGCRKDSEYLFDELAFFQPRKDNDLYMVDPNEQKGIHCRFGMKGVIAENHFDGTRNMIALMGGERRYVLSHPDQCENLALYKNGHPSARHSAVDWSNPDYNKFPQFRHAEVNEVVLQAGDVLYLPTYWFHFIISLDLNFQCNTRSGKNDNYKLPIRDCGF